MLENYNILLENLKNNSHYRDIKDFEGKDEKYIYFKGKKLLNLSSNNYLNFATTKNNRRFSRICRIPNILLEVLLQDY